ncbi:MAG: 30S ribosomal protein S1 [Hyphomicrobiales bacterium]|nr:30S ribosomal protein S1 [Hyphomicrobiales bacterium]
MQQNLETNTTNPAPPQTPSREEFAAMLDESLDKSGIREQSVVQGKVVAVQNGFVGIDVGLKTEGWIPLREFTDIDENMEVHVGDIIDVYLERMENSRGEAILSYEKAKREQSWIRLGEAHDNNEPVEGSITQRVRGGFTVDISGVEAFLPGSQLDIRPMRDATTLMDSKQQFQILKIDRRRGNIVVSRRAVLEASRSEQRDELVQNLQEGQTVQGRIKNITDYGAFVDLGSLDGLLHVTDMSWKRIQNPRTVLKNDEIVTVKILKITPETQRISLGMKQLTPDPWLEISDKYPVDKKVMGRVTNITDYGAFVELEPGIEGLIHVSEMSWIKKGLPPGKLLSTSQEVEVMVLEVNEVKRRISLGLRQCTPNPWESFAEKHPVGSSIEGEVKNITEFGLFISLEGGIDGMVHMSDLDWNKHPSDALTDRKKGETVKAKVLEVSIEKERVSLGIKQLQNDPFDSLGDLAKGSTVTCTVQGIQDGRLKVSIGENGVSAFINRQELSRERSEQRCERFAIGDKIDAQVTRFDRDARRIDLSVKALEIAEEKDAMKQYGSSDSGATLGAILGAALGMGKKAKNEPNEAEKPADTKASAKEPAPESPSEESTSNSTGEGEQGEQTKE